MTIENVFFYLIFTLTHLVFGFLIFVYIYIYIYNTQIKFLYYPLMSYAQVRELLQSHCGDNREGTLFSPLHIYYTHIASMRFEHSVCHGSLLTTSIYIHTPFSQKKEYRYFFLRIILKTCHCSNTNLKH